MNVGSTFSGVGGIDLGLERAGMRVVWQCESDDHCRQLLAQHWPHVPCYEDVRDVQRATGAPQVDLLAGGVPCQDWSSAGQRAGLGGGRSGLFFEFARIADELVRPGGWLLFENVTGLLSACSCRRCAGQDRVLPRHSGTDFYVVLSTLVGLGFHDLAYRVLDSRYFRVPQRRRRVFIVGRRAAGRGACEVLLEPESGGGNFAPGSQARTEIAASLTRGSSSNGVSPPGRRQEDDVNIVGALDRQAGGQDDNSAQAGHLVAGTIRSHVRPGSNDTGGCVVAPALVKRYGKGTDSDATDTLITHTLTAEGFDASEDGTGRGTPLTVAGTIGGGNHGAGRRSEFDPNLIRTATDAHGVRAATEFPGRVDDPLPDGPRYEAMGNAVTVKVLEWIGRRIMSYEAA